ncbi:elongation factor p [Plasmopara halstedii]|uniref:Elongation factor p n=1 Tax=Plasmopara halstedii TaxID=4781 RepID=A0A0P1ASE4_PLAHL|nr:elongation factor p [Plasmopara halstedii]CEG44414.1 elongation factor p [Plasmopara halstedii]|eukprot:XP_024580783.1 elongation factor p [Plasmopara halstedii]
MVWQSITQIARVTARVRVNGKRFASINGNQVRAGMALEIDGRIYRVGKSQHVKPGKGGAYVQAELKEIKTGFKRNCRFRAAETVNKAPLGPDELYQFLYHNGNYLVIMHLKTFEQIEIDRNLFSGRQLEFLQDGMTLSLQIIENDVLWATMPEHVTLEVTNTTPKGVADTALSVKDATLENGAVIKVPLFIEIGNKVKVSTEDGTYVDKL